MHPPEDAETLAGGHEIRRRHINVVEASRLAKDDDSLAGATPGVRRAISSRRADNQVVEAIAVDVTS